MASKLSRVISPPNTSTVCDSMNFGSQRRRSRTCISASRDCMARAVARRIATSAAQKDAVARTPSNSVKGASSASASCTHGCAARNNARMSPAPSAGANALPLP